MDQRLLSLSSTDDQEPELPDPAAQDSTIAVATADAAPDTTSTVSAVSTDGANAQREITSVAARGTMNTAADPHAITNAVGNNTAASSSSPALQQRSVEVGSTSQVKTQFTAPINQFFTGADLGKSLLLMDATCIGVLLGLHEKSEIPKVRLAIMIILLSLGFITLLTSLLFQESCPEYAAPAALVGAACVVATFFFIAAVLLPPQLDPVVWVFAALFFAVFAILCYTVYKKGIREKVHED